jgi:hypothetical protein
MQLKKAVPMGHMVLMEDLVRFLKDHHVQDPSIILGVLMNVVINTVISFADDPLNTFDAASVSMREAIVEYLAMEDAA